MGKWLTQNSFKKLFLKVSLIYHCLQSTNSDRLKLKICPRGLGLGPFEHRFGFGEDCLRNNYQDNTLFYYELQFSILFPLRIFIVFIIIFLFHTFSCIYFMFALFIHHLSKIPD